jgi:hypothetical protein
MNNDGTMSMMRGPSGGVPGFSGGNTPGGPQNYG